MKDGKRPPNCSKPDTPNPPKIPDCPAGKKCDEDCFNDVECQLYFGNQRLKCYKKKCIIFGCDKDSDCLNKDDECLITSNGNQCNPCPDQKCPKNKICKIRNILQLKRIPILGYNKTVSLSYFVYLGFRNVNLSRIIKSFIT